MGWQFYEAPHSYVVRVENPSQAPGFPRWRALTTFRKGNPDSEANARLIAAAPDLLEALEAVIDDLEGGIIIGEEEGASPAWLAGAEVRLKNARAAIAKARGRV